MTPSVAVVGYLGNACGTLALIGLVVRGRQRACWAFTLYLVAVFVTSWSVALWPEIFWTRRFFVFQELLHTALKLTIVWELAMRIVRPFPGAWRTTRLILLLISLATALSLRSVTFSEDWYATFLGQILPSLLMGTAWLFTALAAIVLWYVLPLDHLQKAILIGFVPYLFVFTIAARAFDVLGFSLAESINRLPPYAYLVLQVYWARAAWQRRTETVRPRAVREPDRRTATQS